MKLFGKTIFTIISSLVLLISANNDAYAKKRHHYAHKHSHTSSPSSTYTEHTIHGSLALNDEINRLISNVNPALNVGIQIKSMRYGDTLFNRSESHLFVPASILKIFTAESALLYLGPEYKFTTVFTTDAKTIENGILKGNLYLVHSGDPSLTYLDMTDLLAALKARQIYGITGNVYIDTSAYDEELFGPGWISNDTRFCYAAPISASIINHNCMVVGGRNTSSGKNAIETAIVHYNKSLIQSLFQRYQIQINGDILPGTASNGLPVVAVHDSKPLRELISEMLKKSDNIIAGSLFKKMGEVYTKQPGSWESGSEAVTYILSQQIGVNTNNMSVLDGSGLSRNNHISPIQMMRVLDFAYHNNATNYDFISALPIAGIDGTLKHRMKNIKWKVRAKTGTMSGVVALAGYAIAKDKEPLAFVIIINGNMGMGWRYKEMENKIMTALTNFSRV